VSRGKTSHVHGPVTSSQLSAKTWPDFERLFASNGGVWGGCWCMFFHRSGSFDARAYGANRSAKHSLVQEGRAHGTLVYCGGDPVGWCQFGPPPELPSINNRRTYDQGADEPPDWRIGCIFTNAKDRGQAVAAAAVAAALDEIRQAGGGVVEAYPEQTGASRGRYRRWVGPPPSGWRPARHKH